MQNKIGISNRKSPWTSQSQNLIIISRAQRGCYQWGIYKKFTVSQIKVKIRVRLIIGNRWVAQVKIIRFIIKS